MTKELFPSTLSKTFNPFPPAASREAWQQLDEDLKERLVSQGEQFLNYSYPQITCSDFLEYSRTGNRSLYEDKLFRRRYVLNTLILAECVEYKDRFTDDILNGIWLICEETAWQLPAHNSYVRDTPQLPLPDASRPVIDLFAAETGSVLSMASYLLKDRLDEISPFLCIRIRQKLHDRILMPYLHCHFWWMGDGSSHMNNWTVWCTQNVLLSILAQDFPPESKQAVVKQAVRSIDCFLDEYGEDGCCDEGAQYYRHAGLCLFNCLEILNAVTENAFAPLFAADKIKNMAAYIFHAHISGPYYVNFADCSPLAGRCGAREYLFGKRTGNRQLMNFAASDYLAGGLGPASGEQNLFYCLQAIFTHKEMTESATADPLVYPDLYYKSTGLFITRDSRFYLAVKAGDNDDSHNHNDTGSFTVYKDGQPMFIDVGVETYTKKTFSPERYEIWTMQSGYHNLPTFGGQMQASGPSYAAQNVVHCLGGETCSITMDIASAYPENTVQSCIRTATLTKGKEITIEDRITGAVTPAVISLMCCRKPEILEHGTVLRFDALGDCLIQGALEIQLETISITDPRLRSAWPDKLYRCLITLKEGEWKLRTL